MSHRTWFDRTNPLALLVACALYATPLLTTLDVVTAGVAGALAIAGVRAGGVRPGAIVRRTWPLLIAAPLSGVSMLLYAKPAGEIHLRVWLAVISDESIALAAATVLRVLAVGVPTVAVLGGIDATRLGDALGQIARLPARVVLASLAGIRLFGVLRDDWDALAAARRARGLGDGGRIRRQAGMAFTVLVIAVRRGGRLATAMEARGFGSGERTWARPSTLGPRDALILGAAIVIVAVAFLVAAALGSLRFLGT